MACSYRKAKSSLTSCLALTRLHVIEVPKVKGEVHCSSFELAHGGKLHSILLNGASAFLENLVTVKDF
jgi:hypothetical protein